jgi:hypothetical protein
MWWWRKRPLFESTNSRMKRLLGAHTNRSRRSGPTGRMVDTRSATGTARPPDRTPLAPLAPPAASHYPQLLYLSPQQPVIFQPGLGMPLDHPMLRWIDGGEGTA